MFNFTVYLYTQINKKVRSILNKLTPQKFEILLSQIKEININTENKLKILIGLLFEKVSIYIYMCLFCCPCALTLGSGSSQVLQRCVPFFTICHVNMFGHDEIQIENWMRIGNRKKIQSY